MQDSTGSSVCENESGQLLPSGYTIKPTMHYIVASLSYKKANSRRFCALPGPRHYG